MQKQVTLSALCGASLLLNAFFVGLIFSRCLPPPFPPPFAKAGFHAEPHAGPGGKSGHPPRFMEEGLSVLSPASREKVSAILDAQKEDMGQDFEEMHALMSQMKPILTAQKLDLIKLSDLEKKIEAQDMKVKQHMSSTVRAIAKTLPDEERVKFFDSSMHEMGLPPAPPPQR